jgi:hypothetical protein
VTTPRLGCNVLSSDGWHFVGLPRNTDWGYPDARAWLPAAGGNIDYCRTVGGGAVGERVSCTFLNVTKRVWWRDRTSPATDWAYAQDRAWLSTGAGPAECGRTGDVTTPRLGCNVLSSDGWHFVGLPRNTDWGYPDARAWNVTATGNVSYCRTVGGGSAGDRVDCTFLTVSKLAWGPDHVSPATDWGYADDFGPL